MISKGGRRRSSARGPGWPPHQLPSRRHANGWREHDKSLKKFCEATASCYFPSRQTLILGVYQPGAVADLSQIHVFLVAAAPGASPEQQIAWSKMVVAGHSQGGGHSAAIDKLFPVARVSLGLSSALASAYVAAATAPTPAARKMQSGV